MAGDDRNFLNLVTLFKKARRALMPQVMESQIFNAKAQAGASHGRCNAVTLVGEDRSLSSRYRRLAFDDLR